MATGFFCVLSKKNRGSVREFPVYTVIGNSRTAKTTRLVFLDTTPKNPAWKRVFFFLFFFFAVFAVDFVNGDDDGERRW